MLEQILQFLRYFPHNMEFHIGERVFSGVRFRHGTHFPWHSRRSRNEWFEKVSTLETLEDDRAFKHWLSEWMLEQIHIRFSIALVFSVISHVLLLPLTTGLAAGSLLPAAIAALLSLSAYITHLLLRRAAVKLNTSLRFTIMLIDALIDQEYGITR